MNGITTRRGALRGTALASLASLVGIASTAMADPSGLLLNPDADLIATCSKLIALHDEMLALYDGCTTIADEHRIEGQMQDLFRKRHELHDTLEEMDPPKTIEGAQAMAKTFMICTSKNCKGEILTFDFDDWISLSVIEFMANLGAAA